MEIILRKWQISDVNSLAENINNINIWNNMRDYLPYPYTEKDAKEFIEMVLTKPDPAIDLAIDIDGNAVGGIGIILKQDVERICAEMGYWLGEKYWNMGIMTEAIKQMTNYVFTNFSLHKVYALPFDFNIASHKVLQKAGYIKEATLRQAAIKNGIINDLYYYSIIKDKMPNND